MRILAGDVGGTKTNLALVERTNTGTEVLQRATFASGKFSDFQAVLDEFYPDRSDLDAACFGVAGPVQDGAVELTNLTWSLTEPGLARALGVPVKLLNDLEANAYGLTELPADQVVTLQGDPDAVAGPAALISAGTGLGMALLPWVDGRHHPQATESGHADFAPRDATECAFMAFLVGRFGRASWEHVLSGPGLGNLYDWLSEFRHREPCDEVGEVRGRGEDANPVIARIGVEGGCPLAAEAVERFVSLYASEAGNLALRTLPRGGLYLGGGIAPKLLEQLKTEAFLESFSAKEPFRELLQGIPVRVVLDPDCALWGAVRVAATLI